MENIYYRNATFQAESLAEWQASGTGFLSLGIANPAGFLRVPEEAGILDGDPRAGNQTAHYVFIFTVGITCFSRLRVMLTLF